MNTYTRNSAQKAVYFNKKSLDSFMERFKAGLADLFWWLTTSTWDFFRLRFLLCSSEKKLQEASEARAISSFHDAYATVPAYKKFIDERCGGRLPQTFDAIPITDKPSYIVPNSLESTLRHGRLPEAGQVDTSTGTTGAPTKWIRGPEERAMIKKLMGYVTRATMGSDSFVFINSFALGPWATGMSVAQIMSDRALTLSTGQDLEKVLDAIQEFAPKKPVVVAGYPPFISQLVDAAKKRNIDLKKYNLMSIVGGEGISEHMRERILKGGFSRVLSSYGASDLDINIGYESAFEIELRRACQRNPALAHELYGDAPSPMIFHYDPLNYLIETDPNDNLIYTCLRKDRVSPRIRYNLHDKGRVMQMKEVQRILKKYGLCLPATLNLPLVFTWGREGTAVNFHGAKIAPEHLEQAIQELPDLKDAVENFAFHTYEDDRGVGHVDFLLEWKEGKEPSGTNATELKDRLIERLSSINQEFKEALAASKKIGYPLPELTIFHPKESPMSKRPPHLKKQYIYSGTLG